jgi:hypothetical protein
LGAGWCEQIPADWCAGGVGLSSYVVWQGNHDREADVKVRNTSNKTTIPQYRLRPVYS